jgi:hypothetical protein
MRYISMHKVDAKSESWTPPTQELIQGMGALIGEMQAEGVFVNGDGLLPSDRRVRLRYAGGERTLTRGPLKGQNELVAAFTMIKVKEIDEAIEWATRLAKAIGDCEIDIGPMTEAWDLGVMPKPANAPVRCALVLKGDAQSESGKRPGAGFTKLHEEMKQAGVLLAAERLAPSARATRVKYAGGKRTVVDGPFAESKEMIGGFVILDVKGRDELLAWDDKFAAVIGDVELDLFPLAD